MACRTREEIEQELSQKAIADIKKNNPNISEFKAREDGMSVAELMVDEALAKSETMDLKFNEWYKGKIIISNSGTGKSVAASKLKNVIDGDILLVEAANTVLNRENTGTVISTPSELNIAWLALGKSSGSVEYNNLREEVYAIQAELAKKESSKGNTVLLASSRKPLVDIADLVFFKGNVKELQSSRSDNTRENVLYLSESEIEAKNTKFLNATKHKSKVILDKGVFVLDILQQTPKDIKYTEKVRNILKDSIGAEIEFYKTVYGDGYSPSSVKNTTMLLDVRVENSEIVFDTSEGSRIVLKDTSDRYPVLDDIRERAGIGKSDSTIETEALLGKQEKAQDDAYSKGKEYQKDQMFVRNHTSYPKQIATKKLFKVRARILTKKEKIITSINGEKETVNIGNIGDYVVTGLKGEKYIVKPSELSKRYEIERQKDNNFILTTKAVSISYNIARDDGKFTASWGEEMIAHPGDALVYENGILSYRIEKEVFENTYDANVNDSKNKTKVSYDNDDVVSHRSSKTGRTSRDGKKILDGSKINNYSAIVHLIDNLEEIDNVKTTAKHATHLKKVLGVLIKGTKEPLREMNIYLSEKYRDNGGFVTFGADSAMYLKAGTNKKLLGTSESLVQKFVHEMIHGSSYFSLNFNKSEVTTQIELLKKLRAKAFDVLTPEMLLGDSIIDEELELLEAQGVLDHMNDEKVGLEEFLAIALTNEKVFEALGNVTITQKREVKNLIDAILNVFETIVNAAMQAAGRANGSMKGDVLMMKLVSEIASVNRRVEDRKNSLIRNYVSEKVDDLEKKFTDKMDDMDKERIEKHLKEYGERNADGTQKKHGIFDKIRAVWYVSATEEGAPLLQSFFHGMGMKEEGTIQTILRHVRHADEFGNTMQKFTMASGNIDMHRENQATKISNLIRAAIGKMGKAKQKSLYVSMMMGDGISVVHRYKDEASKLYDGSGKLEAEIEKAEKKIKELSTNDGDNNLLMFQAKGLAEFMMTGEGSVLQRKNASAIVAHAHDVDVFAEDVDNDTKTLVDEIDNLSSLYAIQMMDETVKNHVVELMNEKPDSLKQMASMQDGFRAYMNKTATKEERMNLAKNYHRQSFDNTIDHRIAPLEDREKMRDEGFVLVEKLRDIDLGYKGKAAGLYVGKDNYKQAMNRSSFRYTNDHGEGSSLMQDALNRGMTEISYDVAKAQVANGKSIAAKLEDRIRNGEDISGLDKKGVVSVVNSRGEIVDYKTESLTRHKLKHLGLDTDAAESIGRSWSHELDIRESEDINKEIWSELMFDMGKHAPATGEIGLTVDGKGGHRYVDINVDSVDSDVADVAKILPPQIREKMVKLKYINLKVDKANKDMKNGIELTRLQSGVEFNNDTGKYEIADSFLIEFMGSDNFDKLSGSRKRAMKKILSKNSFRVRRDMLLDIFGVRDWSLASLVPNKKMYRLVRKAIAQIEMAVKELVKIFKVDMIIRTIPVIMGNIVSNLMYSIQYGHSPLEIAKRQLHGVKLLRSYLKTKERIVELEALMFTDRGSKELKVELDRLRNDLKYSDIAKLMDSNLYQHIVEDTNIGAGKKSSSKIANWIDDRTEGSPELIKSAGHWLFVSEKTSLFQMIAKATAYSDFVARYAQFSLSSEKEQKNYARRNKRSMSKAELEELENGLVTQVRDAYVNYAKPDSKYLQYANDIGLVAFSKYAIRIQLGIQDLLRGKPLRFGLAVIGQELFEGATGINPEDVAEKSIFNRSPENWVYTPEYSKMLGDIIEPQGVTWLRDGLF